MQIVFNWAANMAGGASCPGHAPNLKRATNLRCEHQSGTKYCSDWPEVRLLGRTDLVQTGPNLEMDECKEKLF